MLPLGISKKHIHSFKEWIENLPMMQSQLVLGLTGAAKHLAVANAYENWKGPIVVVTPTMLQATQLYEELVQWYEDEVYLFTVEESLAAEYSIHSPEVVSNRIRTLQFLTTGEKGIVVVPLSGIQKP